MSNDILNPITISLKDFNEECKSKGIKPFPIETFTFTAKDQKHFDFSINNLKI